MQLYASDNGGFVPRDHTPWRPDRRPYWMVQAGAYLKDTEDWESARTNFPLSERLLQDTELFHCPEHPLAGEVPGTYVINAFRFESKPDWNPDGPVKLAQIREGGDVVWIGEAADQMRGASILLPEFHDAFHPEDLPGGSRERLTDSRHNNATNILFFDSSVRRIARGKLTLPMFDDGIRQRSTPSVFAGP